MELSFIEKANAFVSVIVTTYNRQEYLEECLTSIQNQTYQNIEVLVIDDGSNTVNAAANKLICSQFSKCKYLFKPNTGQPDSRNYGIKKSKGSYLAFCDDDDYWVLNKLEQQLEVFNTHPNLHFVTGCIGYINEYGKVLDEVKCHEGYNQGKVFEYLLEKNRTSSITPILKREVFDKVGCFNSNFTIAEDWEFWRRVSYFYEFYNTNTVLAFVRVHSDNMSKTRTGDPIEHFLLYRKLTKSLLKWGATFFTKEDIRLIYKIEWRKYKKIMTNRCPGVFKKVIFFLNISLNNLKDGIHLVYLFLKFNKSV